MAYAKTTWQDGDLISAQKMNNVENGIESLDTQNSALSTQVGTIGQQLTTLSGKVDASETAVGNLETQVDGIEDNVGQLNERIEDDEEALVKKAPAIFGEVTDYWHMYADSFTMHGNEYAFGNARYANRRNYVGNYKGHTGHGMVITPHNNIVVYNGTATTSNDIEILNDTEADIPAGTYTFTIEPHVGNSVFVNSKAMHIQFWYDGNDTSTNSKNESFQVKDAVLTRTFTLEKHVHRVRIWGGYLKDNVYDDYRVFFSLFPSDATIVDTGETIASNGSLAVTPADSLPILDTMMHTSTARSIVDTKKYIDEHVPDLYYIRPEDYGAVGDGVTDDTVALQACLTAAIGSSGRTIPVRGYGIYKITGSLTITGTQLDIYLHHIIYTGSDAAVIFNQASVSRFMFDTIEATAGGSAACGIRLQSPCTTNYLECTYVSSNGNTVEFITGSSGTLYYNELHFTYQRSANANIIYASERTTINETDIYGKYVVARNGWLFYRPSFADTVRVKLHNYSLESALQNGVHGNAFLIGVRTAELMGMQTNEHPDYGYVYDFTGTMARSGLDETSDVVNYTNINIKNANKWEDALGLVKARFEAGYEDWEAWGPIGYGNLGSVQKIGQCQATAHANIGSNSSNKRNTGGVLYAYWNHLAFKPNKPWHYTVNESELSLGENDTTTYDWIYPTILDINTASAVIHFDFSYCCAAIDDVTIIQHEGKEAIVYDKNNNVIFDGTGRGKGVYHLKCAFLPLDGISVTLDGGTVKSLSAQAIRNVYTGDNEVWTVTKEELIESTGQTA